MSITLNWSSCMVSLTRAASVTAQPLASALVRSASPDGPILKQSALPMLSDTLTMRMGMRRFTRLTNAFSKKIENHLHMLSLYFVHYNFCRIHKSLRMSPATVVLRDMAAGVSDTLRDVEWIVGLIDATAPKPKLRGPYKKRISN